VCGVQQKRQRSGTPSRGTAPHRLPPYRVALPSGPSTFLTPQPNHRFTDRPLPRHDREPAIPQGHRTQKGVRIGDSAGQDPRELIAPEERSQARCASTRRESVPLASLRQRQTHPETGGFEYPRQNFESAAFWSATSIRASPTRPQYSGFARILPSAAELRRSPVE
jgi:hypothetical protein